MRVRPFNQQNVAERRRVLLAEDDDELRTLVALLLSDAGFETIEVSRGDELVLAITSLHLDRVGTRFDLLVTDVRMPGCSGLDAVAHLRRFDRALPVVVFTGLVDREVRREAARLGVAAVLRKPYDLEVLCATALQLVR